MSRPMTWNNIKDKKPVHELPLLVRTADHTWQAAQYNFELHAFETADAERRIFPPAGMMRVTHWMDVAPPTDEPEFPDLLLTVRQALTA